MKPAWMFVAVLSAACASSSPEGAREPAADTGAAGGDAEAGAAASLPPPPASPADAVAASPAIYRVLAEDERLRVLLATWAPGQRDAWHSHPRLVAYALTKVKGKLHLPGGETKERELPQRTVTFQAAVKAHVFENTGEEEAKLLFVELKPGAEVEKPKGALPDAVAASPDIYEVKLELEQMRVVLATFKPKQRDKPHAHPPHAAYHLTAVDGRETLTGGKRQNAKHEAGTAVVSGPLDAHAFENTGSEEAQILLFELK